VAICTSRSGGASEDHNEVGGAIWHDQNGTPFLSRTEVTGWAWAANREAQEGRGRYVLAVVDGKAQSRVNGQAALEWKFKRWAGV
jgi:hypothetical protein